VAEVEKEVADGTTMQELELPRTMSVRDLADMLKATPIDVIKQLMRHGLMANINQVIDYEVASKVAGAMGFEVRPQTQEMRKASVISEIKKQQQQMSDEASNLKPRPPVVTIMGHVDHGKTRILDAIRRTNVMDGEAGGITQHIGAYQVDISGQKITFLDTPGHEAFTAMRARGAQVTDITVLVVAADDGVMPQTLEAIAHAKAAGVPIIVAINKMDKVSANPDVVKKQLAEAELLVEDWGGDTVSVPVSAKTKQGIETLLENILLVAEMENLRADPSGVAKGVVIEARMDKSKGAMATVLVHDGTLRTGDMIVVGTTSGKVKAMYNDAGKQLRKAGPATPVAILGLHSVPQVGDAVIVAANERHARTLEEEHRREAAQLTKPVSLSNIFDQINAGQVKELPVVLKVDVQGSIEPIRTSLERLSTPDIKVNIVHAASGNINDNDVNLAIASKGIVIAFNTGAESNVQRLADAEHVDVRRYQIIYEMIDDVERAIKGLREPEFQVVVDGRANVREVFTGAKKTQIAGLFVIEGKIRRDSHVRVNRAEKVLIETTVLSLRRFKDNVRDVSAGYECGIGLNNFNSFQVGDILDFYHKEKVND